MHIDFYVLRRVGTDLYFAGGERDYGPLSEAVPFVSYHAAHAVRHAWVTVGVPFQIERTTIREMETLNGK